MRVPEPYQRRYDVTFTRQDRRARDRVALAVTLVREAGEISRETEAFAHGQLYPGRRGAASATLEPVWMSQATMGEVAGVSERTAREHLRALERVGLAVVGHRKPRWSSDEGRLRPQTNLTQFTVVKDGRAAELLHEHRERPTSKAKPEKPAKARHRRTNGVGAVRPDGTVPAAEQRYVPPVNAEGPPPELLADDPVDAAPPATGSLAARLARLVGERAGP